MENNLLTLDNLVEEIKEKQEEKARLEELYKAKLEQLKANYDMQIEKIDNAINYFKEQIRVQFETQPYKETISKKKLSLLSGTIEIKKSYKKFNKLDENILFDWCKENAPEYIDEEVIEKLRWGKLKNDLLITKDYHVVNKETGEIVDLNEMGLELIEVPEKVVVKFNDKEDKEEDV
jgi:hypothetical protein